MLKRWYLTASIFMLASLMMIPAIVTAESARSFRQQNGLVACDPPAWFLEGYFIAREKSPCYVFGPVQDFVVALGGTTAWLIEDLELSCLEQAVANENESEYSLFLEVVSPGSTEYWVFVVLPYEDSLVWFDARRAFHGRKAVDYYGETQRELDRALSQGLKIKSELRFFIDKGDTSVQAPEELIMKRYKMQPVFDLKAGRMLIPSGKSE